MQRFSLLVLIICGCTCGVSSTNKDGKSEVRYLRDGFNPIELWCEKVWREACGVNLENCNDGHNYYCMNRVVTPHLLK